jgi:hypothetical protein
MTGPHLTKEQFAYYLAEKRMDTEAARHLVACPLCREEHDWFTMLVSDFNDDTMRWSEARVAGSLTPPSHRAKDWRPLVRWAMAACLLLVGLLSVMLAGRHAHHERATIGSVQREQNSREQIANDNRVLTSVYEEINAPVTVPMQEYGFSPGADPARRSKADSRAE